MGVLTSLQMQPEEVSEGDLTDISSVKLMESAVTNMRMSQK